MAFHLGEGERLLHATPEDLDKVATQVLAQENRGQEANLPSDLPCPTFQQLVEAILTACNEKGDAQTLGLYINLLAKVLYKAPLSPTAFANESLLKETLETLAKFAAKELQQRKIKVPESLSYEEESQLFYLAMYTTQLFTCVAPMMTAYSWDSTMKAFADFVNELVTALWDWHERKTLEMLYGEIWRILRNYFSSLRFHELLTGEEDVGMIIHILNNQLKPPINSAEESEDICAFMISSISDIVSCWASAPPKLYSLESSSTSEGHSSYSDVLATFDFLTYIDLVSHSENGLPNRDKGSAILENLLNMQEATASCIQSVSTALSLLENLLHAWDKTVEWLLCSAFDNGEDVSRFCHAVTNCTRYLVLHFRNLPASSAADVPEALLKSQEERLQTLQQHLSALPSHLRNTAEKSKEFQDTLKRVHKAFSATQHLMATVRLLCIMKCPDEAPEKLSDLLKEDERLNKLPVVKFHRISALAITVHLLEEHSPLHHHGSYAQIVSTYKSELTELLYMHLQSLSRSIMALDKYSKIMQKQLLKCCIVLYEAVRLTGMTGNDLLDLHQQLLEGILKHLGICTKTISTRLSGNIECVAARALVACLHLDKPSTSASIQKHVSNLVDSLSWSSVGAADEVSTVNSNQPVSVLICYLESLPKVLAANDSELVDGILSEIERWLSTNETEMSEDEKILLFALEDFVGKVKNVMFPDGTKHRLYQIHQEIRCKQAA